ncbi:MAG: SLC13 family permease [Lachnospiraceae bacterium]|jgi:DASS family divalent anion:Na+ symporter
MESTKRVSFLNKKTIAGVLGIVAFVVIGFVLPAPASLAEAVSGFDYSGRQGMIAIAALLLAIIWWIGMVIPAWCTALILQCVWVVVAGINFSLVFSAFSKTSFWLVIGAFMLATVVTKTGLLKRISLNLMKLFSPTYKGQSLALILIGTICSPLMPSTTAKAILGAKIATSSSNLLGYADNSKGRVGLFIAAFSGFSLTGTFFISASFLSASVLGSIPEEYARVSWIQWFIAMIPIAVCILVGMFLAVRILYKPTGKASFSKEDSRRMCSELGKMSKSEKIATGILVFCLFFWILESFIGVHSAVIAVIGGVLCFCFKVLEPDDIKTGLPWDFIIFMGVVLNMGEVFTKTGLGDWLQAIIYPLTGIMTNKTIFVLVVFLVAVAMRFVLNSQAATITISLCVFSPLSITLGINPFITGLVVYSAVAVWIAFYQNPTYLAGFEAMEGTIRHSSTVKAGICYLVVALIGCLVSIPYWSMLGYM